MTDYLPLGNDTGLLMLAAQQGAVAEIAKLVLLKEKELGANVTHISDWGEVSTLVKEELIGDVFPTGTTLHDTWTDTRTGQSTQFDYKWRCVDEKAVKVRGITDPVNALWLHSRYTLPFATQFDEIEAFYAAPAGGLAAGTYSVTINPSSSAWGQTAANTVINFTLGTALEEGGQLAFSGSIYSTAPTSLQVKSFASPTATSATETLDVSSGSAGTSLGTIGTSAIQASDTLNHMHRVGLGNNNYAQSALRQFLNSTATAGNWWTPQNKWDRPPAYAATTDGFLSGFSTDFIDHLAYVEVKTALPYCDGGTSGGTECTTLYDRVFLPSMEQLYWRCTDYGVPYGLEGTAWEYWKEVYGGATPAPMGQTFPIFAMGQLGAETTMRGVFERSASRGYGYNVTTCYASGTLTSGSASYGYYCAPACCIV